MIFSVYMENAIEPLGETKVEVFSRVMFLEALSKKKVSMEFLADMAYEFLTGANDNKLAADIWKTIVKELIGQKAQKADGDHEQKLLQIVTLMEQKIRGKSQPIS